VPLSTLSDYFKAVLSQKWETDAPKGGQNRNAVLAAFVGLTWFAPCQKLEAEVFQTIKFLEWTFGRVVSLQLDYTIPIDQNSAKRSSFSNSII
jgi:hypothetical protein